MIVNPCESRLPQCKGIVGILGKRGMDAIKPIWSPNSLTVHRSRCIESSYVLPLLHIEGVYDLFVKQPPKMRAFPKAVSADHDRGQLTNFMAPCCCEKNCPPPVSICLSVCPSVCLYICLINLWFV